jgi:hypothetical protein
MEICPSRTLIFGEISRTMRGIFWMGADGSGWEICSWDEFNWWNSTSDSPRCDSGSLLQNINDYDIPKTSPTEILSIFQSRRVRCHHQQNEHLQHRSPSRKRNPLSLQLPPSSLMVMTDALMVGRLPGNARSNNRPEVPNLTHNNRTPSPCPSRPNPLLAPLKTIPRNRYPPSRIRQSTFASHFVQT